MKKLSKKILSMFLALLMLGGAISVSLTAQAVALGKSFLNLSIPRANQVVDQNAYNLPKSTVNHGWTMPATKQGYLVTTYKEIYLYYCIEPGAFLSGVAGGITPDYVKDPDKNFIWKQVANYNGHLNGDGALAEKIAKLIVYYGYHTISTNSIAYWTSSNIETDTDPYFATQSLIWELATGERDANFDYVSVSGCIPVYSRMNGYPTKASIDDKRNTIINSVKQALAGPSFCTTSSTGNPEPYKLKWENGNYTLTINDNTNSLDKYTIKPVDGLSFIKSSNQLTIKSTRAFSDPVVIEMTGTQSTSDIELCSDNKYGTEGIQDIIAPTGATTTFTNTCYFSIEAPHVHTFIPRKIAPTCTEVGYTVWTCGCGISSSVDPVTGASSTVQATGHNYDSSPWVIGQAATCTKDGQMVQLCNKCGQVINTEVITATGHDDGIWKVDVEATPSRDGQKTRYCTKCGEALETQSFAYHTHTLGHTATTKSATCTQPGEQGNFCSVCGACYETVEIPATGHKSGADGIWLTTTPATCTQAGEATCYCPDCGAVSGTKEVAALGHSDGKWITNTEPTCTEKGEEICICDRCGETISSRTTDALGHDSGVWVVSKEATCTEKGEKSLCCTLCGKVIDTEETAATGHDDGVWKIDFDATADHDGQKSLYCTKCNDVLKSEAFSYHQHTEGYRKNIVDPTCVDEGEEGIFCATCGAQYDTAVLQPLGHDFSGIHTNNNGTHSKTCSRCQYSETDNCTYEIKTTDATCTTAGNTTYTCSVCGYTYSEGNGELGHKWNYWQNDKNGMTHTRTCQQCGMTETGVHVWSEWRLIDKDMSKLTTTYQRKCEICGATQTTTGVIVQKDLHTLEKHEAVPNTCLEDGNSEYYYCTDCGKYFSDSEAKNEIAENSWIIPAHGHDYHLIDSKSTAPTCTEGGLEYYECSYDSSHVKTKELPAHGHNYVIKDQKAPLCEEDGYIYHECTYDASHNYTDPLPAHDHDYKLIPEKSLEPTPEKDGYDYYECTYDPTHIRKVPRKYVGDLDPDKTVDFDDNSGVASITLSASTDAKRVVVKTDAEPVDVVLVLDTSGSMKDKVAGSDKSKLETMQSVAESFVDSVYDNSVECKVDNRIAVVGFSSIVNYDDEKNTTGLYTPTGSLVTYDKADFGNAFLSVADNSALIKSAIGSMKAVGATRADIGMQCALNVLAQSSDNDRQKVVIFLTDGYPTIRREFDNDVADGAIYYANTIKNTYSTPVYSIGFNTDDKSTDMTTFMNAVSSNYPSAQDLNNIGTAAENGSYYIYADGANALDSIFQAVYTEEVVTARPFDNVTLFDTVSKYFTMTISQQDAFRAAVKAEYGVKDEDIIITLNDDFTTSIRVENLKPKTLYNADGEITGLTVSVTFDVTANENAVEAGIYDTNTEDAGVEIDGLVVDKFKSPRIEIKADRTILIFKIGDEVYSIENAAMGSNVTAPVTELASWNIPDGTVVTSSYAVFTTNLTTEERVITWHTDSGDIIQTYNIGSRIIIPEVPETEGKLFTGWNSDIPAKMGSDNLEFTAEYEAHTHDFKLTSQSGSCTEGITHLYTCSCGKTKTVTDAPCEHELTATITNDNGKSLATITCANCNYSQQKYITYSAEYDDKGNNKHGNNNGGQKQELDLTMYNAENVEIQPDSTIQIKLPLQSELMHQSDLKIYRINEDGTKEYITYTIVGNTLVMNVDHFSYYIISGCEAAEQSTDYSKTDCGFTTGHNYVLKTVAATCTADGCVEYVCSDCGDTYVTQSIPATGHTDSDGDGICDVCNEHIIDTSNCKCMCHSNSKIVKFLWTVINFFNKLFKINKYCDCGVAHY